MMAQRPYTAGAMCVMTAFFLLRVQVGTSGAVVTERVGGCGGIPSAGAARDDGSKRVREIRRGVYKTLAYRCHHLGEVSEIRTTNLIVYLPTG